VLTGDKVFVVDGLGADAFVVVARTAEARRPGRAEPVLVPADAAGVRVSPVKLVDSRNHARLRLDAVKLDASMLLGAEGEAGPRWMSPSTGAACAWLPSCWARPRRCSTPPSTT
jgi:alkylation response protein AidB-like acyl-CoA dehydrogenase